MCVLLARWVQWVGEGSCDDGYEVCDYASSVFARRSFSNPKLNHSLVFQFLFKAATMHFLSSEFPELNSKKTQTYLGLLFIFYFRSAVHKHLSYGRHECWYCECVAKKPLRWAWGGIILLWENRHSLKPSSVTHGIWMQFYAMMSTLMIPLTVSALYDCCWLRHGSTDQHNSNLLG